MEECIFCKIAKGESPAEFEYQGEEIVAFYDISPKAPVHILIVPKRHIKSVKEMGEEDSELLGKMILTAKKIAQNKGLEGYKLIFNCGRAGGQIVDHLHLHLMGGWTKNSTSS